MPDLLLTIAGQHDLTVSGFASESAAKQIGPVLCDALRDALGVSVVAAMLSPIAERSPLHSTEADRLTTAVLDAAIVWRQDLVRTHPWDMSAHERELITAVDALLASRHDLAQEGS